MKLIPFLNSGINKKLNDPEQLFNRLLGKGNFLGAGYANGYVAIPKDHPYYGMDYDEVNKYIVVHGGLTFSKSGSEIKEIFRDTEFLKGESDLIGYWVLGFDTCHYQDSLTNWPRKRVIEEVLYLEKQLEEAYYNN